MRANVRDNFDSDLISKIIVQEVTRALNLTAEAIAGGAAGARAIGIRSVFKHDSKGTGKPSPKGTPPGVDTGTLRRSFRTKPAKKMGKTLRVSAGTDVDYAIKHEFGIRTPKRPFMKQGIDSAKSYVNRLFAALGPKIKARCKREAGPIR